MQAFNTIDQSQEGGIYTLSEKRYKSWHCDVILLKGTKMYTRCTNVYFKVLVYTF